MYTCDIYVEYDKDGETSRLYLTLEEAEEVLSVMLGDDAVSEIIKELAHTSEVPASDEEGQ